MSKSKQQAPEFNAKVSLESLKGEEIAAEAPSRFGVHATMIRQWKRVLIGGASGVFEGSGRKLSDTDEAQVKAFGARVVGASVKSICPSERANVMVNALGPMAGRESWHPGLTGLPLFV